MASSPATSDNFENLSLEDEQKSDLTDTGAAGEAAEVRQGCGQDEPAVLVAPVADSLEPATLSASVERSLEQTVDMPAIAAGHVSLSPVDERDLIVTISEPKVTNPATNYSGPFATYAVTTRTTRQTFDKTEYSVRRRYQDFIWLREQLALTYRTHIVPPLPEKHSLSRLVQNDHFTEDFLERRRAALQKFLGRCTDHPTMSFDRTLNTFLIASDQDFQAIKNQGAGLLSKVQSTVVQAATAVLLKKPDPEFVALQQYFSTLGKHLAGIESSALAALQDGQELKVELYSLSQVCQQWSGLEKEDGKMLSELAACFQGNSEITDKMCQELSSEFSPFHEYLQYCESAQEVLKRREVSQMDHDMAVEELQSRQVALDEAESADMSKSLMSFFSDPTKLKQEKIEQAQTALEAAQKASERTNDDMEVSNEHLRADMTRWEKVKKSDLAETFVNVADVHISHLQKSLDLWTGMLESLEKDTPSSASASASGSLASA
ncbi:sorting nexin-30-like [Sycon ciliatum]|uniref:sorting nexin-30-like n=1 Tax=Sycon ciliatum TaxID=27933 RepID=UPI0031F69469